MNNTKRSEVKTQTHTVYITVDNSHVPKLIRANDTKSECGLARGSSVRRQYTYQHSAPSRFLPPMRNLRKLNSIYNKRAYYKYWDIQILLQNSGSVTSMQGGRPNQLSAMLETRVRNLRIYSENVSSESNQFITI